MNATRRIATMALVAAGLAANLGSNFVGIGEPITADSGLCRSGSTMLTAVRNQQTGAAGAPLATTLELQVSCTDSRSGLLVRLEGSSVTWTVRSGNGSVNGSPSAVNAVDVGGSARVNWSLGGSIGTQTVSATVTLPGGSGSTESSSTFTATATAPRTGSTCASGATVLQTNRSIAGTETWTLPGSPSEPAALPCWRAPRCASTPA